MVNKPDSQEVARSIVPLLGILALMTPRGSITATVSIARSYELKRLDEDYFAADPAEA